MRIFQFLSLFLLGVFYFLYILKGFIQKSQGIKTNLFCRGEKNCKEMLLDILVPFSTVSVLIVEILSILNNSPGFKLAGIVLQTAAVIIFATALGTMKNSWRVGFAENQETTLITNGIFSISRNPAFVGFDLLFVGILVGNYNLYNLIFTVLALISLHIQIIREEKYLERSFGAEYRDYCKKTGRYMRFGIRKT